MKICDIVQAFSPKSGGVKRYIVNKMRYLAKRPEHKYSLIIPSARSSVTQEGETRIHEIRSPQIPGISIDYRILLDREEILAAVLNDRPEIIEVDNAYNSAWNALTAGETLNVPVLGYYHSEFPRKLPEKIRLPLLEFAADLAEWSVNDYLKALYNRMSATLVATAYFENLLREIGVERLVRIPLGVNVEDFRPRDSRADIFRALDLPEETVLLIFVGRLAGMKNIDVLIGMMDQLAGDDTAYHLLIVGEGELHDEIVSAVNRRSDATHWPYISDRNELTRVYSAADLFVHAGDKETFGLVSLEAQACGVRVIVVKGGGMDETLEGEAPQIFAAEATPDAFAAAVREAVALKEDIEARQNRHIRMVNHFSWRATFDRLTALYGHLIDGKPVESFS